MSARKKSDAIQQAIEAIPLKRSDAPSPLAFKHAVGLFPERCTGHAEDVQFVWRVARSIDSAIDEALANSMSARRVTA